MAQTMLLTKRLTAFLSQNTTPQNHTLLLLSPTGKLLSSASPSSTSFLRHQATIAVSIWHSYHPFPSPLVTSTGSKPSPKDEKHELSTITIQLENGIMCIRALQSGLLFVAIGGAGSGSASVRGRVGGGEDAESEPASPNAGGSQVSLQASSENGSLRDSKGGIWGVKRWAESMGEAIEGRLKGFELSAESR